MEKSGLLVLDLLNHLSQNEPLM
uniref:Uncharacterized protein n=1 Tax=Arundo donax TaxID=35708 RepID=A0A0A9E1A5_ARUDO